MRTKEDKKMAALLVDICDEVDGWEYARGIEKVPPARKILVKIRNLITAEYNPEDLREASNCPEGLRL